jgi:DNA-binding transcriptional regulator PaaX
MIVKNRSITAAKLLGFLSDTAGYIVPETNRRKAYKLIFEPIEYKGLEDYFPSVVLRAADKLQRRGLVEKVEKDGRITVKITDKGKQELLWFDVLKFKPEKTTWDGKWRMVFFDVEEKNKRKRESLRGYLERLGMKRIQDSVYISPFDVFREVRYLREVMDIPHVVKLVEVSYLENEEDLKGIFGL